MRKLLFLLLLLASICVKANYWEPNPYQFQSNMTVIGVLSFHDEEQRRDSIEVGAFCGDECRGSVITEYDENLDRYYVYMMIYGNHNDSIAFRCYDHKLDMELIMIPESYIFFKSNDMIGSVMDPFVFSFQCYQHNINVDILPEAYGSVTGDGVHYRYDTCFIDLTPSAGYQLDALTENGDTLTKQTHYSFIVLSDRHFVAHFSEAPVYYQITAETDPMAGGTVTGSGQYLENDECTLLVTTNAGFIYEGLYENDQLVTTDTVYTFTADSDKHFVAKFSIKINYYQISSDISPDYAGSVSGLGVYEENEECVLEITPNVGYEFVALRENGAIVTEEPHYVFTVESNRHFVAEFVKLTYYYDISAEILPENAGTINGLGSYQEGNTCTLEIVPNENYRFVALKENDVIVSEDVVYNFVVDADRHFIAEFVLQEYEVRLHASPEEGGTISGTGSGTYAYGSTFYAIANPNDNYVFKNWTNENGTVITTNPQYVFEVTQDINLTANFEYVESVYENNALRFTVYPNPASDFINIKYDDSCQGNVVIYDLAGKMLVEESLYSGENTIDIRDIPAGVYVIAIDEVRLKLLVR